MNNAGIRPLIFESLFVMPPFALGRHHACLLQHAHEVVGEVLLHDLALFVPVCDCASKPLLFHSARRPVNTLCCRKEPATRNTNGDLLARMLSPLYSRSLAIKRAQFRLSVFAGKHRCMRRQGRMLLNATKSDDG